MALVRGDIKRIEGTDGNSAHHYELPLVPNDCPSCTSVFTDIAVPYRAETDLELHADHLLTPESLPFGDVHGRHPVLGLYKDEEMLAKLAAVREIFCDLDDTLLVSGTTQLEPHVVDELRSLQMKGVRIVFVTGKPLAEVRPILQALPSDLCIEVMYEKGAGVIEYRDGEISKPTYLLGSRQIEVNVELLKQDFFRELSGKIEKTYGVTIGLAGSGKHQNLLSIDLYNPGLPHNYLELTGDDRAALKIKDSSKKDAIYREIADWFKNWCDQSRLITYTSRMVVDLMNGNIEIALNDLEKDVAIKICRAKSGNQPGVCLGDSGNDRKMFELKNDSVNLMTCLVLNHDSPRSLILHSTFIVGGRATGATFLRMIHEAKEVETRWPSSKTALVEW